jgi:hypothetical protein
MRPESWTAEWFAALVRNAHDDADELRHIEKFLDGAEKLTAEDRQRLRAEIDAYLVTAKPSPPDSPKAKFRHPNLLLDTTADEDPRTFVIFFGPKRGEGGCDGGGGVPAGES